MFQTAFSSVRPRVQAMMQPIVTFTRAVDESDVFQGMRATLACIVAVLVAVTFGRLQDAADNAGSALDSIAYAGWVAVLSTIIATAVFPILSVSTIIRGTPKAATYALCSGVLVIGVVTYMDALAPLYVALLMFAGVGNVIMANEVVSMYEDTKSKALLIASMLVLSAGMFSVVAVYFAPKEYIGFAAIGSLMWLAAMRKILL